MCVTERVRGKVVSFPDPFVRRMAVEWQLNGWWNGSRIISAGALSALAVQ